MSRARIDQTTGRAGSGARSRWQYPYVSPCSTTGRVITLRPEHWPAIKIGRDVIAYAHSLATARAIVAGPQYVTEMFAALNACNEALRYPRGLTDSECVALRSTIGMAISSAARASESCNLFASIMPRDDRKPT
jgi:hypothetical protein